MTIGKTLKEARENKGYTQNALAENTGISRNYLSDLERDRYNPSVKTLVKLSKVLDIDLNFLLKNDGNTNT